ncbi:MAG: hypothetical protein ACI4MQ_06000 [Candidatus Coproplasma sp.]
MNDKLFRKKSVDRMSSPEQLNDYIKVTNPGVWMVLAAIAILLLGICIWGFFGKLETKLNVAAVSENGQIVCYVKEENVSKIKENLTVRINEKEYTVTSVASRPVAVSEEFSEYALHVGELKIGEWVYVVNLNGQLEEGDYKAQIIINSVSPMSFVFN